MNLLSEVFGAVCDASWRASILIVLFLAIGPFVRGRIAGRIVFLAWVAVAIRLVIPCSVPVRWSPFGSPSLVAQPRHMDIPSGFAATAASPTQLAEQQPQQLAAQPTSDSGSAEPRAGTLAISQWAAALWMAGVIILAGIRIGLAHRFRRQLRRTATTPDPVLNALTAGVSDELGIRRLETLVTDLVAAPAVQGLLRPKLLFPPRFAERFTPDEARFIIAHELGHCRHRDLAAHTLLHTAQVLHWFNPLVWLAARAAKNDCEIACDEFALARLGFANRSAYGATLLKVLSTMRRANPLPGALAMIDSNQHLKRRIQMIITFKPTTLTRTLAGSAVLALVVGLGMTRQTMAQESSPAGNAGITTTAPHGWWQNGDKASAYVVGVDRIQTHGGLPSAYVKSIEPSISGFGGMMQMCSADEYRGKRLRFSAWMRTEQANDGGAHLWFRIDGEERRQMLRFDNMDNRPVKGTTDWQQYSIVLDVPPNAAALAYGFFIAGTGQAWISDVKVEEVGQDTPTTNITPSLPKKPVNLSFD